MQQLQREIKSHILIDYIRITELQTQLIKLEYVLYKIMIRKRGQILCCGQTSRDNLNNKHTNPLEF